MGKRCHHCRKRKPRHVWTMRPCALGQVMKLRLCTPCDVGLNAYVLRFARHPKAAQLIAKYRVGA